MDVSFGASSYFAMLQSMQQAEKEYAAQMAKSASQKEAAKRAREADCYPSNQPSEIFRGGLKTAPITDPLEQIKLLPPPRKDDV